MIRYGCMLLMLSAGLMGQDVPQQNSPGTASPDMTKQRRPAPVKPGSPNSDGSGSANGGDVPQQQPGTNSPDVGKQRSDGQSTNKDAAHSGANAKPANPKTKSHHHQQPTDTVK